MAAVISGVLVLILGLALAVGGVWLVLLGGSWYYLLAAIGMILAGALLAARRAAALWVYALVVFGTLAWAVAEVGFDWWQLAPRGDLVVLLGLWLLTPWVTRRLDRAGGGRPPPAAWRGAGIPLAVAVVLAIGAGAYAIAGAPSAHRLAGSLPGPVAGMPAPDTGGVPPGEWHAYGRTDFGRRYSPLDQITTVNVDRLRVAWTYHTGDLRRPTDPEETTYEVTPLKIGDTPARSSPRRGSGRNGR